jgi:hypothetical protein
MIRVVIFCLAVVLLCPGCDLKTREEALKKKEAELAQKEQQLLLKEKSLALQEQQLLQLKQQIDSVKTKSDTALVYNQQLIGVWNVKMTCTETTCPGSAVGDTKSETWDIGYENNNIIAKAIANNKLARIYTGSYDGNNLTLTEDVANVPSEPATKMTIRLTLTEETKMDGQREIVRENDCRIVYNLQLNKQKPSSTK